MIINIKKFGDVLSSRQAGKEAYLAYLPTLNELKDDDELIVDFDGVTSFSPSWGDEFITPIFQQYGERMKLKNTDNLSVKLTLSTLEKVNNFKF